MKVKKIFSISHVYEDGSWINNDGKSGINGQI